MSTSDSYRFPINSLVRKRYTDRAEYLKGSGARRPKFCHVLEARVEAPEAKPEYPYYGLPWLTPVLGSGCLGVPLGGPANVAAIADFVMKDLESLFALRVSEFSSEEGTYAGTPWPLLASQYTRNVLEDRFRNSTRSRPDGVAPIPQIDLDPLAPRIALIAALCSRAFFLSRAEQAHSLGRIDSWEARFDVPDSYLRREAFDECVAPALALIDDLVQDLRDNLDSDPVLEVVAKLLTTVADGLGDRKVRKLSFARVQDLNEVAVYYLTRHLGHYPGWSDLLLGLMLLEGFDNHDGPKVRRPTASLLSELPESVRSLMAIPTEASWRQRFEEGPHIRNDIFGAVAEVLRAQWLVTAKPDPSNNLPPAVAISTSFDVELEMSLRAAGTPYSVALPVHLRGGRGSGVEATWLIADARTPTTIGAQEDLDELRKLENWRLLAAEEVNDLARRPTVVHLSGCPFFDLPSDLRAPELETLSKQLQGSDVDEKSRLFHAVTVDEYLALRLAESEIFWSVRARNVAAADLRGQRGLNPHLLADGEALENRRFWMAMGVPVDDPAIRHRIMSQLTVRGLRDTGLEKAEIPAHLNEVDRLGLSETGIYEIRALDSPVESRRSRTTTVDGVVVNERVDGDEIALLHALGLDVVETDCRDFVGDLRHYAQHVAAGPEGVRLTADRSCNLETGRFA